MGQRRLAPGPALTVLSPLQADSIIVRTILDTNRLYSVSVASVAHVRDGRVVALTFAPSTAPISELPGYVAGLSALRELTITDCGIVRLPHDFDCLEQLHILRLDRNRIVNIPEEIGDLTQLRELSLARNMVVEVPGSVCRLRSLGSLDISHNRLTSIPDSLGSLRRLRSLDISSNRLLTIPPTIGLLDSLLSFKADQNNLESVPTHIADLQSIRVLSLSNNRLRQLPEGLGVWPALNVLQVSYNQLERLPASLAIGGGLMVLDVRHNRLSAFPEAFADDSTAPGLASLRVDNNRLCRVSPRVARRLHSFSSDWRESQNCASTQQTQGTRVVAITLGDSAEIDGQMVAFLACKDEDWGRRRVLLIQAGTQVALYESGWRIGREGSGSRVLRCVRDQSGVRVEVHVSGTFVLAPVKPGEYEITGAGARVLTREAGEVTLEEACADSATLLFERGIRRSVKRGSSISLTWGDVRAGLTCRWVLVGASGPAPEFYPDSAPRVDAVGFTLTASGVAATASPEERESKVAGDPSATVAIYDLGGRLLASAPYRRADELAQSMPNGHYVRKIEGGGEIVWDRFVVNR